MNVLIHLLAQSFADQEWRSDAACAGLDPEMFFPRRNDPVGTARAKAVCNTGPCPVRAQCLAYALSHGETFGVFGGRSERQRRRMRRGVALPRRRCALASCRALFVPGSSRQRYCRPEHTRAALAARKRVSARRCG